MNRLAPLAVASVVGLLAVPTSTASPSPGPAPAVSDREVVRHTVADGDARYRLRLRPVDVRGPAFGVFTQGADGSLTEVDPGPARTYAGSVVGRRSALAVAVRRDDGTLSGQITIDGRETLFFDGATVTARDGTERPDLHWPSADDASRNVTVSPGQVPVTTRRWDLGFDLDHTYVVGELGGDVARAVEEVELTTVELMATYESNARLRPALGRVVLRTDEGASPYADGQAELGEVRAAWESLLDRDQVDAVAHLHSHSGGGVAYVGTIGSDYAVGVNGGGNNIFVIRHELGHNWGPSDNHTNGPEGQTIESGNDYARFDGTELAAIFRTRTARLRDDPGRFPRVPASQVALPPYATLDLRAGVAEGSRVALRPLANDVDANGDRLELLRVPARSWLGGRLETRGNRVVYVAPDVETARTLDWFRYTVVDEAGRTGSGVVMLRVGPRR